MTTLSQKPESLLEKLGYKVISVKTRQLDELNIRFGNVGFTYNCLNINGKKCKINVSFHTNEKTFSMAGKNISFKRKGVVNNTVFHY